MAKELFPHKIVWLASYPKSGNTWFRAFLSALLNDGEVEINSMKTDGILSSREIFEMISDIDSRNLYDEEVKNMLPDIYSALALEKKQTSIIKVHDAYSYNAEHKPIIPTDITHCAVYIIRNPLDVVGSFANHNNSTIDQAIDLMNNKNGGLALQKNNLNINSQLRQLMYDWSGHVESWTTLPGFPVYVVRYEDMLLNTFDTFKSILEKIGWHYPDESIQSAIAASSFEQLSSQEKKGGFNEKTKVGKVFFRSGKMGNWKEELTGNQSDKIISAHRSTMEKFGYNLSAEDK